MAWLGMVVRNVQWPAETTYKYLQSLKPDPVKSEPLNSRIVDELHPDVLRHSGRIKGYTYAGDRRECGIRRDNLQLTKSCVRICSRRCWWAARTSIPVHVTLYGRCYPQAAYDLRREEYQIYGNDPKGYIRRRCLHCCWKIRSVLPRVVQKCWRKWPVTVKPVATAILIPLSGTRNPPPWRWLSPVRWRMPV